MRAQVLIFVALMLLAVNAVAQTPLAAATSPISIALNWKAEPQFGGFYEAALKHLDQKAGLSFTLVEGGSGTPTVQMLANGKVDFAIVSAEEILISNQRNPKNPVLAVYAVFQTNPQMIMCHAEMKFKSLSEVFKSPDVTLAWESGLSFAQFLMKKYPLAKAQRVPYLGGVANFLADSKFCQQGFITSEPLIVKSKGVQVSTFLISDEGFNPYTTVLAVRRSYFEKHKDEVERVIRAVDAGWHSYVKDPLKTNQAMHTLNPAMSLETFKLSADAQKPLINPDGRMTLERWQELAHQIHSQLSPKDLGLTFLN